MAIEINVLKNGKVIELNVSGKPAREDYKRFVPEVEKWIQQHGKINILFRMHDFHGWQAGALWEDIKFDMKHFADINRLAIIGEKLWQKEMSKFCASFTTANIRYFQLVQIEEAKQWIEEEGDEESDPGLDGTVSLGGLQESGGHCKKRLQNLKNIEDRE